MLTLDEGIIAVNLARKALSTYIGERQRIVETDLPPIFSEKRGVFVTLHEEGELRGCIGYPEPIMPLGKAIIDSAINAGTNDYRFSRVDLSELKNISIEITVLTKPETITVEKRKLPEFVKIGRHGLIVAQGMRSGLLLPQVATEWGFDPVDFLCQTCMKAGLPVDAWLDERTEVRCFEAQIFSETAPGGTIIEKEIDEGCSCQESD